MDEAKGPGVDTKKIVGLHASRSSVPPSYTGHAYLAPSQDASSDGQKSWGTD